MEDYCGAALQHHTYIVRKQSPRSGSFTHCHRHPVRVSHTDAHGVAVAWYIHICRALLFLFSNKNGIVGPWGNDKNLALDTWHYCKSPGDGPENSDRFFYSSPYLFAWGVFCLSCCITGCYDDEGLAGSSTVPVPYYPAVQSRELADFPCVQFGSVMSRLGIDSQISLASSPASGSPTRSPR